MSKFTKISSSPIEQSLNFIIPIVVLLLIGMLYVMTQREDTHFANFVSISLAACDSTAEKIKSNSATLISSTVKTDISFM